MNLCMNLVIGNRQQLNSILILGKIIFDYVILNQSVIYLILFPRSLLPHSSVTVLPHVGHYPHWEDEKGFLNGYFEFLDRIGVIEQ